MEQANLRQLGLAVPAWYALLLASVEQAENAVKLSILISYLHSHERNNVFHIANPRVRYRLVLFYNTCFMI